MKCLPEYPFINVDGKCAKHPSNPWCLQYINISSEIPSFDEFLSCDTCLENYYPDQNGLCMLAIKKIP